MKKNLILASAILSLNCSLPLMAVDYIDWVEWDLIEHWAGDPNGEKKCAFVVDFQDGKSNQALVWGYRWNGQASGEDLIRAVAAQSSILTAMIQYTGTMGSTLNALGVSPQREELDYLLYDFTMASVSSYISFGYYDPNFTMGQESAPGFEAEDMCYEAIERGKETGIIEHPLNAFIYGYPAYDYDFWQLDASLAKEYSHRWKSGWYDGYWSYWHGPNDYDFMSYSGLGMSSTQLVDGGVQAWKYTPLNGGEGFGATGGEMAYELNYDMGDWGEEMHEEVAPSSVISHNEVKYWVGEGEKEATVVFRFNDGKGPENLVYGYRWTGGWDDSLAKVLENIAKEDPRLTFYNTDGGMNINFDSDHDGKLADLDHNEESGTWKCFVKRVIDPKFTSVPSGRWLNPKATMIVERITDEEITQTQLPDVMLMRPEIGSSQVLTLPDKIEYTLSDSDLQIPFFVTLTEGSRLNTAFTWSRPEMLSRINTSRFMGTVSSYSNFHPSTVEVTVRGSMIPKGSTEAVGVESNKALITFHAPEIPVKTMEFENEVVALEKGDEFLNPIILQPSNATYTRFSYRSSNPAVASVNAATGEVTIVGEMGEAKIIATYNADDTVSGSYIINVGNITSLEEMSIPKAELSYSGGVLTLKGLEGETVVISSISGSTMMEINVTAQMETYSLEIPQGIYIVSAGKKCRSKIKI